jgi:hypothetical protein
MFCTEVQSVKATLSGGLPEAGDAVKLISALPTWTLVVALLDVVAVAHRTSSLSVLKTAMPRAVCGRGEGCGGSKPQLRLGRRGR